MLTQLFLTFGLLSLLSIGGANATIPEIHRQVVSVHHWMNDETFATLVAIGQTAPGPNVLIVSIIGWNLAGLSGLLVNTAAIVLPSSTLALGLGRIVAHNESNAMIGLARRALAPVAIGLMLASAVVMTRAAYVNAISLGIVGAVAAMVYFTRLSPVWGILAGAVIGLAGRHLGVFG